MAGWQDAPVVTPGTATLPSPASVVASGGASLPVPAPQAAWMSAPVVPQTQSGEGYLDRVKRTGDEFNEAAGTGIPGVGRTAVAALEDATAIGSGVAGDIAGAATSLVTQNPKRGEKVRSALTYQPKTAAGQAGQTYIGALAEPVSEVAGAIPAALERRGYPIVSQVARAGIDVGLGRGGEVGDVARDAEETAARSAIKAGYTLKPSNAGGRVGKVVEGLSGSARLGREAAIKNQKITNRLAAEEIGLGKDKVITPLALKQAKAPHNAVYEEVGQKLGEVTTDSEYKAQINNIGRTPGKSFPQARSPAVDQLKKAYGEDRFQAADAVEETRKLRAAARKNIKAPNDPEKNELGYAQLEISDALERQMERYGQKIGQGGLISRFRKARQELAKINSVESSIISGTGDVSATSLAKQAAKKVPLSGKLKLIADTATRYPEEMRAPEKLRDKTPISVLEGVVGGGAAAALHNPLALGAMAARPAARAALRTRAYQDVLADGNTLGSLNLSPATRATLAADEAGTSR